MLEEFEDDFDLIAGFFVVAGSGVKKTFRNPKVYFFYFRVRYENVKAFLFTKPCRLRRRDVRFRDAFGVYLTKRKPHAKRVDKNKAEAMDRKKLL